MPEINIADHAGDSVWNHYVSSHHQGGPYLMAAWKKAVEKAYGHRTFYLAAFNGHTIVGVLPLILIKPPMARGALVSLPFCDYGGILADHNEAAASLLDAAIHLRRKLRTGLEIRTSEPCRTTEATKYFSQMTDKCRMILELPGSADQLWADFKSKLRSQITRGARGGLVVRLGHEELIDDFYRVFSKNMRDLGSPVHSMQWMKSIAWAFGKNAATAVVYKNDSPVGAGIVLVHNRTVTIPWASTLKEFNQLSPNMLLYWTFLKYASDNGYRYFDFGRSTPGEGIYAFKKQWGAQPAPLFWYRFNGNKRGEKTAASFAFRRDSLEKAWQRLPLKIANTVGPHLRKYIDR